MIADKKTLREYLEKDRYALGIRRKRPHFWSDEVWRFLIYLRKHEYYLNVKKHDIRKYYYGLRHHYLGIRLGFSIPCNVFIGGTRINHYGLIVVNAKAKIGEFCDIHQGVNIGEGLDRKAPQLGNNVWIGPGAKLYGGIEIGNNVMIGANSVVNKSFKEDNIVIAGAPARIVARREYPYSRKM
jgi:serine O-acetyltransferase